MIITFKAKMHCTVRINNNRVTLSTTFTQNTTDGQVSRTVGAIDLEFNSFFAQFPLGEPVAITAQAQALPQMNGAGMVRNMREAVSLSGDFAAALSSFASGTTRDGQRGMLDELIKKCASTSRYTSVKASAYVPFARQCKRNKASLHSHGSVRHILDREHLSKGSKC